MPNTFNQIKIKYRQLKEREKPIMSLSLLFTLVIVFILASGWVFVRFYRMHIQGDSAPEQTAEVTILDKQSIPVEDVEPGMDDQEYWIYVQKGRIGPKREFQVGVHYYHALNPGDHGTLTYQGDKFLHFALKR